MHSCALKFGDVQVCDGCFSVDFEMQVAQAVAVCQKTKDNAKHTLLTIRPLSGWLRPQGGPSAGLDLHAKAELAVPFRASLCLRRQA